MSDNKDLMLRVMMIGRVGCGKTTLKQRIKNESIKYDKTQVIEFSDNVIDTPGEYLENRIYLNALVMTANEADIILLLEDATQDSDIYSYNFASAFSKPVIGIISKVDQSNTKQVERARKHLIDAGANVVLHVGFDNQDQLNELLKRLQGGVYGKENESSTSR